MRDWIGQHIGNYTVLRLLEQGTLINRYLGADVFSQRQVTLFLLTTPTDEMGIRRFDRNVPVVKRLVHPHIAPLLEAGVQESTPFLVLDHFPTSRQFAPFPLPLLTVVRYVAQLAEAFDYAHQQGVWHSYTTPETIVIGSQGEALLEGFGMRLLEISSHWRDQSSWMPLISPAYLSPEQISRNFQERSSDQYALAVVVYEWLCGVPPFQGFSPLEIAVKQLQAPPPPLQERMPACPQALEQVMAKALAKVPAERFSSVTAFRNAIWEASQKTSGDPA